MYKVFFLLALIFSSLLEGEEGLYKAKDFSYLIGKTPGLDAKLISMHLTLYKGYVKSTNTCVELLEEMEQRGENLSISYGALKRQLAWEMDGMMLHELYFENLGASTGLSGQDPLYRHITRSFGSFNAWKDNFVATGMIRGIGWVILYYEPIQGRLYNIWVDNHNIDLLAKGIPLLVMDVWEHAYITEYGLNRRGYIKAFFENINWNQVQNRFTNIRQSQGARRGKERVISSK